MNSSVLNQFALNGKHILVTGASAGIGRKTAIHISALGGSVIITGRDQNRLTETFSLLEGDGHLMFAADLTNIDDINRLVNAIGNKLDGIVHSAGVLFAFPAKYLNTEEINNVFRVNYFAPIELMTKLFKEKKINKNCSVVFISSFSAKYPYALGSIYTSSKAALESYAKCLALENAGSGLRSNSVLPALVRTNMYDITFNSTNSTDNKAKAERYEKLYPRGIGEPEDVANMITFLLSDASKWITGQSFVIDGGYLLGTLSKVLE